MTDFRAWQGKKTRQKHRELLSHELSKELLSSRMRKILDGILPLGFVVCWMAVLVYWILRT